MRLTIMDRYILREVSGSFFFGVAAFLAIFMVDILMELIDLIISKGVAAEKVLRLFLYALPAVLVLVIPMALLFSVLIGLGRLASDNEIVAMKAGGIQFSRIVMSLVIAGVLLTGISLFINEFMVPTANSLRKQIYREVVLAKPLPKIAENVFFNGGKNRTFFIRRYDPASGDMKHITLYETDYRRYPDIIDARTGSFVGSRWVFRDGILRRYGEFGDEQYAIHFASMSFPSDHQYQEGNYTDSLSPREMSFRQLKRKIDDIRGHNVKVDNLLIELWSKTSLPFACLIFVLIGAPLAVTPSRSGKSIGMGLSIVIIFVYYIIMAMGRALGEGGKLPALVGAWLPNLVIGVIGIVLIWLKRK